MRRAVLAILGLSVVVAGCSKAQDDASKYDNMVKAGASSGLRCAQARQVASDYAAAGDKEKYDEWLLNAYGDCHDAGVAIDISPLS